MRAHRIFTAILAVGALSAASLSYIPTPTTEAGGAAQAPRCDPRDSGCHVVNSTGGGNPSTFANTCDDVNGTCTLNDAVWASNFDPANVTSKIHFDIPGCQDRKCTIKPAGNYVGLGYASPGKPVKNNIEVNGATQNCASWPCITVDGSNQPNGNNGNWGLKIFSSGVTIANMGFRNFQHPSKGGFGVIIYGREPLERSLVQANNSVHNNLFENNEQGIRGGIECSGGTLRDSSIASNTIRNSQHGIYINVGYKATSRLTNFRIENNLIQASGISAIQLVILDAGRIDNNLISANTVENPAKTYDPIGKKPRGIVLTASDDGSPHACGESGASIVESNIVQGNKVVRFADDGIQLIASGRDSYVRKNTVRSNDVSQNGKNGIHLLRFTGGGTQAPGGSDGNVFLKNVVIDNSWLAINLGEAFYVGGVGDALGCIDGSSGGGAQLVNGNTPCPRLTKTLAEGGKCRVKGAFARTEAVTIEIYLAKPGPGDETGTTSGPHGEARKLLATVNDPDGGSWSALVAKQSAGSYLTATATTNSNGTSELALDFKVSNGCST